MTITLHVVINDVTFKIIQQKAKDDIEISLQFETQVRKYITIFEYSEDNDKLIQKKDKIRGGFIVHNERRTSHGALQWLCKKELFFLLIFSADHFPDDPCHFVQLFNFQEIARRKIGDRCRKQPQQELQPVISKEMQDESDSHGHHPGGNKYRDHRSQLLKDTVTIELPRQPGVDDIGEG